MATIKYQEDEQGNKKIIVKTDPATSQQKVSCGCCACGGCGTLDSLLEASTYAANIDFNFEFFESYEGNFYIDYPDTSLPPHVIVESGLLTPCYRGAMGLVLANYDGDNPNYEIGVIGADLFVERDNEGNCAVVIQGMYGSVSIPVINGTANIIGTHSWQFEYTSEETQTNSSECAEAGGVFVPGDFGAPDICYITSEYTETITIS
jgi:hypothetical protein